MIFGKYERILIILCTLTIVFAITIPNSLLFACMVVVLVVLLVHELIKILNSLDTRRTWKK